MDRARRRPVISAIGVMQILAWGSSFHLPAVLAGPIAESTGRPLAWVVGGLTVLGLAPVLPVYLAGWLLVGLGMGLRPVRSGLRHPRDPVGRVRQHPVLAALGICGRSRRRSACWWSARRCSPSTCPGAALVIYGGGNGIFSIARGTVPLALFGADRYALLVGRLARPGLASLALAPLLGTLVLTHGGADALWMLLAGLSLANMALVAVLWRLRAT